jgi:hypothetical protein
MSADEICALEGGRELALERGDLVALGKPRDGL